MGNRLTAYSHGQVIGGTLISSTGSVNAITIFGDAFEPGLGIQDFGTLNLADLLAGGTAEAQADNFWRHVLASDTRFNRGLNEVRMMGDVRRAAPGESVTGGNDTFNGLGGTAVTTHWLVGDAAIVRTGAIISGGDDLFINIRSAAAVIGDFGQVSASIDPGFGNAVVTAGKDRFIEEFAPGTPSFVSGSLIGDFEFLYPQWVGGRVSKVVEILRRRCPGGLIWA